MKMLEFALPKYRCHKTVSAAKIIHMKPNDGDGSATLWLEGNLSTTVDHIFMAKHNPSVGGYYVIYDDGYTSWSPGPQFEAGYTLIEED